MAKKILLCGGDAFVRDTLTRGGYEVVGEAANGEEALRQYALCKPDLVLLDLSVPAPDAVQTIKQLKQQDGNACILICVSVGQRQLAMEAVKNGAKDFLVKPFLASRVLAAVCGCLS